MSLYKDSISAAPAALIQNELMPTPRIIADKLVVFEFTHWNFEGHIKTGMFVIHELLVNDLRQCMKLAWEMKFPLHQAVSPALFGWCDKKSCEANNSSAHNMRYINGTRRLSKHAGAAFDLNPMQNPCVEYESEEQRCIIETIPQNGRYAREKSGTLYEGHPLVELMTGLGWTWGGIWKNPWDPQHFQKVLPELAHLYK